MKQFLIKLFKALPLMVGAALIGHTFNSASLALGIVIILQYYENLKDIKKGKK